jgi:hypothetical protein
MGHKFPQTGKILPVTESAPITSKHVSCSGIACYALLLVDGINLAIAEFHEYRKKSQISQRPPNETD